MFMPDSFDLKTSGTLWTLTPTFLQLSGGATGESSGEEENNELISRKQMMFKWQDIPTQKNPQQKHQYSQTAISDHLWARC